MGCRTTAIRWKNNQTLSEDETEQYRPIPRNEDEIKKKKELNAYQLVIWMHNVAISANGCETWSLTLREECRLGKFENSILKQTFGPKRDENGEWRRPHNKELHSLYRSPNIIRVIKSRRLRWAGHVATMEESRSAFKVLTGKPTGKGALGRPRRR